LNGTQGWQNHQTDSANIFKYFEILRFLLTWHPFSGKNHYTLLREVDSKGELDKGDWICEPSRLSLHYFFPGCLC
jgi:hypothetical protein